MSAAEQLYFAKQDNIDSYQFSYQWLDSMAEQQAISFSFNKKVLFEHFRDFKSYKPNLVKAFIYQEIKKQLSQQPFDGVQVTFPKDIQQQALTIKGTNAKKVQQAQQQLNLLKHELTLRYLDKNYYHHFITEKDISAIKPNHISIADASVKDLKPIKPLILAKVSIQNIRKVTNYVLSFVQSIPYVEQESRLLTSGIGFSPPLKLLWENQGDCDSKVTLAAAILRSLMPRINIVLIFIKQHAFLGLAIPVHSTDITLTHENITYVLAEPVGPALLPLGKISATSEQRILNGHYSAETYKYHK